MRANGKLLITGEYFVLDGALALALPCRFGQSLQIHSTLSTSPSLQWTSIDADGEIWFNAHFSLEDFSILQDSDNAVSETLQKMLRVCREEQASFLVTKNTYQVTTRLDFPRLWGLGTSSTLVYLLAQWAQVNPYSLLEKTMGGSGYDIACAAAEQAILYQKAPHQPIVTPSLFNPSFQEQLYFVYLGKKQNSRDGIRHYRKTIQAGDAIIDEVSNLTRAILAADSLELFQSLLNAHETLVAKALELPRVQDRYFSDFPGVIKSLGAWGGDFVLVSSNIASKDLKLYFKNKGLEVCIPYQEMVLTGAFNI